jgi:hypothetical protein
MTTEQHGLPCEVPALAPEPAPATTAQVDNAEFTVPWRQDPHEPLTPEDPADLDVLKAAFERGYRLAGRCLDCGHWITVESSLRRHLGPRCAAKRAELAG